MPRWLSTGLEVVQELRANLRTFSGMKDSIPEKLRARWTDLPFDRGKELLETAQDHVFYGEEDEAVEIWKLLVAEGGEDADSARLDHAEYLFDDHRKREAYAELDPVLSGGPFSDLWLRAVEMLEDYEPAMALSLYLLAIETITAEELRSPARASRYVQLVEGRRRLKWEFGLCLSEADLLVEIGYAEDRLKRQTILDLVARTHATGGLLRFWDRRVLTALNQYWPRGSIPVAEAYYLEVGGLLRARGRSVANRLSLADWTRLAELATDARHFNDLPEVVSGYGGGTKVEWPPGRNQACWCGSGTKYKKCCGGPGC